MTVTTKTQTAAVRDSRQFTSSSGNELLPFIQQGEELMIDARLLHKRLDSKSQFSHWIRDRIRDFGFEAGRDWFARENYLAKRGGHNRIDYIITLDMAKELAMLERTEMGSRIRRYFIEVEKKVFPLVPLPTDDNLFKDVPAIVFEDVLFFNYKQILLRAGYNPKYGYARRRTYLSHFVQEGRDWYITQELSIHLLHQKQLSNNRVRLSILAPAQQTPAKLTEGGAK